ncbi:hypothetical protein BH23GEM9_BH23GEM9_14860 [soil metagenome]
MSRMMWVVLLLACAPARPEVNLESGSGGPPELASTLNVRVESDSALLELHVTNVTNSPVTLEFATTQRYDFEVIDEAGEVVWRWSDEMMFGQALGQEVLLAGESRQYRSAWRLTAGNEARAVRALLTSTNYPVELRTSIQVAGD